MVRSAATCSYCAGSGADTVTLADVSSVGHSVGLDLGGGTNTATVAGSIGGSLRYNGRDGNDTVTIADTAKITDNFFARLGAGDNVVNHNGNVGGNFTIVEQKRQRPVQSSAPAQSSAEPSTNKLGLQQSGEDHEVMAAVARTTRYGSNGSTGTTTTTTTTTSAAKSSNSSSSKSATVARLAAAVSRLRR